MIRTSCWDKVVSIEYVGEKPTYDLEIPDTHNFIANDILVHNSHAADYAVITVQTAYLKAHYPVEYMAAQLLVERDKTEKVINFVSECRRMGVDVLPPDVNYSGLDFDIQLRPPDTPTMAHRDPSLGYPFPVPPDSAIRFGMAAIKNVGEGPVQVIIQARQAGGAFASLEEFCDRVDLRQVNKRALECLIKAGAFDRWGRRSQLLAVIETMVAQSAGVHDARDSGQLSMFDLLMGDGSTQAHVTPIKLPDIDEVKGKEKLQWEKELLGVYSISHPLMQLGVDLKQVTTCSCAELDERYNGKGVTLAGIITNVRVLNTKKGDPMAFVALEDLQGSCEVVFFPKVYAEHKEKLMVDTIIIAKGKAQTREGQTSLLADVVNTHFDKIISVGEEPQRLMTPLFASAPTINGVALSGDQESWDDGPPGLGFDDNGDLTPGENPFRNELPDWLRSEAAPPPLPVATPAVASVTVAPDEEDAEATDADATEADGQELEVEPPVVVAQPSLAPLATAMPASAQRVDELAVQSGQDRRRPGAGQRSRQFCCVTHPVAAGASRTRCATGAGAQRSSAPPSPAAHHYLPAQRRRGAGQVSAQGDL